MMILEIMIMMMMTVIEVVMMILEIMIMMKIVEMVILMMINNDDENSSDDDINNDNAHYDSNKDRSNNYDDMFISIDYLKHLPLNRSHITSWNPLLSDRQSGGFEGSPRFNLR